MQRKLPPNVTDAAQTITNAQRKNCLIDESCACGMGYILYVPANYYRIKFI